MGRKRGREFMNPVVMLASYVTASNCLGSYNLKWSPELAETVGIASLDREVKRMSGVWGRTSGVGTVVSRKYACG